MDTERENDVVDTQTPQEEQKPVETQKTDTNDDLAVYKTPDGEFDAEKIRKLAEDKKYYRQQISKLKQLPDKIEDYGKDFVLDSKFDSFVADEKNKDKINSVFEKLDKLSMEKGIGTERNHDIRRFILDELVEAGAIDLTSPEQKAEKEQKIINERNEAIQATIGEVSDIESWNKNLFAWLKDFCNSDAEYEMHKKLAETNSLWALSLNKIRQAQLGNRIPVIHSDAHFNQAEWDRAFAKATPDEQNRMLEERAKELTKNK